VRCESSGYHVERHSPCGRPVTPDEDHLWTTCAFVIAGRRHQRDDVAGLAPQGAGTIIGGKPTRTAGAEERKRRGSTPPYLRRPVRWRHLPSRQRNDEAVTVTTKLAETYASLNDAFVCKTNDEQQVSDKQRWVSKVLHSPIGPAP
jgi:hypothetical protein